MAKKDDQEQVPANFPDKWWKIIQKLPEFKDTADAASVDDLKKIVVTSEGNIYTIEQEKEADVKLNASKDLVKEYSEPYRDAIKAQTAKIKYAMFLLEGKGVQLDNKD